MLKLGGKAIAIPLTFIINTTIAEGVFPDKWKVAKVTPLHKKEDKMLAKNYRPVSLLSVSGMVCERMIAIQIESHFEMNNLFGEFQFGFRKNKSTVSELITLFDSLMEAKEKKKEIALILYDLSAAFDTIDPKILLEKLQLYGFDKKAMDWISSYLQGRKQAVTVKGEVSSLLELELGTPQGSRLSPLLFNIIMADLAMCTKKSHLSNFADDTQSIVIEDTREEVIQTAQEESEAVTSFFSSVNLVNNADKAALIYNSGRKATDITINIGGEKLTSKTCERLLGMTINSDLDWKDHIEKLCRTLKQRIGLLRRIKYKVDRQKLPIIAEAIFTSKIRYGLAVFGSIRLCEDDPVDPEMERLQVAQNDMMRVIKGYTRSDKINMRKLREDEGQMSVNQLSFYHSILEMYSIVWKNSSNQLKRKILKLNSKCHTLRSETRGDLIIPQKPSRGCVGFSFKGPVVWNHTPKHIRENTDENAFKKDIKDWILTNIPQ
jgi:hypothetical protein